MEKVNRSCFISELIILFLFWICISGSLDGTNLFMGLSVAILVSYLSSQTLKSIGMNFLFQPRRLLLSVKLVFRLIIEIIKSNIVMAKLVFDPRLPLSPGVVRFKPGLESDLAKVILANTITLTPGTLTIDIKGDEFIVHVVTEKHADGLFSNEIEDLLFQIEEDQDGAGL
jgi:multicomponent Na+:H+ antiporter subunit E